MQISFSPHITSIYILYRANFTTCSFSCDTRTSQTSSDRPASLFCPPCNRPLSTLQKEKKKLFFCPSTTAAILDVSLFQGRWTRAREGERERERERGR